MTPSTHTPQKPLSKATWWMLFLFASFTLSQWFRSFKVFTITPILNNGLLLLGVSALVVALLTILAYDSYVQEHGKGSVAKPIRLFEWWMREGFLLPKTVSTSVEQATR